jgi:hypothetical protein
MSGTEDPKNTGTEQPGGTQADKSTASDGNEGTSTTVTTFTQADIDKALAADRTQYGRDRKILEEREKAIKAREDTANATQHEIDCFSISKEYKVDPATLKEAADELGITAKEQITALAKRLTGTAGTGGTTQKRPDPGTTIGGSGFDLKTATPDQKLAKGFSDMKK